MLKNIPKILSPEMLKVLCEMGHSDRLVIADGNFPAESIHTALRQGEQEELTITTKDQNVVSWASVLLGRLLTLDSFLFLKCSILGAVMQWWKAEIHVCPLEC